MQLRGRHGLLAILGVAAMFSLAVADECAPPPEPALQPAAVEAKFTPHLLNANPLIGADVTNPQGEDLGTVEDLVLNAQRDRVVYAAVGYGGILGIGTKYLAVPWEALEIRSANRDKIDKVILNVPKADLESAKGFDTKHWPAHGDPRWVRGLSEPRPEMKGEKVEMPPRPAAEREMRFRRLTEIVGLPVKNLQAEELGDIEDVVLDLREGRPVYSVLGFGGFLGLGEKLAAVPWSAVDVLPRLDSARIDADKSLLTAIAYEQGSQPDLARMDHAVKLHERFNAEPYWQVFGYVEPTEPDKPMRTQDAWRHDSKYNSYFDAGTIVSTRGTVQSTGTFRPGPDASAGLRLRIKTNEGKATTVYAGPQDYAARKGFQFHYGDEVIVTGSLTKVDGRSVIMATSIRRGDKTLEIRSEEGLPNWPAGAKE